MLLTLYVGLVVAPVAAADRADKGAIDWASQPVRPNETVLLLGGPFDPSDTVTLSPIGSGMGGVNSTVAVAPLQVTEGSYKFVLPADQPEAQWSVQIVGGANAYQLNAPEPWWVQGDKIRTATPGGYLRVFGNAVAHTSAALLSARTTMANAEAAVATLIEAVGSAGTDAAAIAEAVARLADARAKHRAAKAASASVLRLTLTEEGAGSTARDPVVIPSLEENTTRWAAWFPLPITLAPGTYTVEIANGLAPSNFVKLQSFVSPSEPRVTTVTVESAVDAQKPWEKTGAKVFNVADYGAFGLPNLTTNQWANASLAVEKAIDAAAAAGGGTVYFKRGTYFLNTTVGFTVPWGVRLQGEGKELVELIFSETYSVSDSGPAKPYGAGSGPLAMFRGPETGTGAWAISDLTVYVTAFHNMIVYVNNRTVGFEMTRCRITADSFLGGNGPNKGRSIAANVSWTINDPGEILVIQGSEYLVEDNDLYGDGTVITSTTQPGLCPVQMGTHVGGGHCHGSAWGSIRNNRLFNGPGSSHFMNQWKQVVFEDNTIIGVSAISMGNSVGTGPGGGYDHHIYHHRNSLQFVWGNDREIVTFDDAGSAYMGAVAALSPDGVTLTLAGDARTSVTSEWGGWDGAAVMILNGTGAGTWRRVVQAGIDSSANPGEWTNPKNRTWVIDRPFVTPPTQGQTISIVPARARIIFEDDHFQDGGTLQFYGQAQECVVDSLLGERIAALVAWGQWRGWYLPPCGTMGRPPCPPPSESNAKPPSGPPLHAPVTRLGGEMGNGIMMNAQLSYLNNRILVGNKIVRWSATDSSGRYGMGFAKFYNGASFAIEGASIQPPPKNCKVTPSNPCEDWSMLATTAAVVYRGNTATSNSGFNIGGGSSASQIRDVVIDGNTIEQSDPDKAMQISPALLATTCVERGNVLS